MIELLRSKIAHNNIDALFSEFEKLENSIFLRYHDEIILHQNRLDRISQNNRKGLIAFSEAQLEESRIVASILNMISQIEKELRSS